MAITAAELLVGSDEDFVINLYLAILGRWPDPDGFTHLIAKVSGRPEARIQAIVDLAGSPEAAMRGNPIAVPDPLLPAEPLPALTAQFGLRTAHLHKLISSPPPTRAAEDLTPLLRETRAEIAALRREMRERIAEAAERAAGRARRSIAADAQAPMRRCDVGG